MNLVQQTFYHFLRQSYQVLVSVMGGPEGHFAIVARSLSIPTIVGVKNLLIDLKDNEPIVLDGEKGILIKNPTVSTINIYKKK